MEAAKTRALYQFKVSLRGISPQIWRRIQVWEDYTLDQLHRVLQVVMGWEQRSSLLNFESPVRCTAICTPKMSRES